MGGERRRMGRLDDRVAQVAAPSGTNDQRLLLPGRRAPEHEHDPFGLGRDRADHCIGEGLPPPPLMGVRLVGANSERGVQEQHPLTGPGREISMKRPRDAHIGVELFEHVDQRRRRRRGRAHREAQPVGLAGSVVRILAQDHDLHFGERREVQRREDLVLRREHRSRDTLCGDERLQFCPVGLGQLGGKHRIPVGSRHPVTPQRYDRRGQCVVESSLPSTLFLISSIRATA